MFSQEMPGGFWWAVLWAVAGVGVAYVAATLTARLVAVALLALARRRERAMSVHDPDIRRPTRVIRWTAFVVLLPVVCLPAIRLAGIDLRVGLSPEAVSGWLFGSGLRIVVILMASYVLVRIVGEASRQLEAHVSRAVGPDLADRTKRARTLGGLVRNAATSLVVSLATLMILREVHVDITPILTGAGILGLAVGFGGQTFVRDLISGFFLIVENQIRVGDVAIINGTGGTIEQINLRTVVLRDGDGTIHVFPSGAIAQLANRSKDFSYYTTDVAVSYRNDLDRVMATLRQVGDELAADAQLQPLILAPLEILGVEALRESQVAIRVRIKTRPLKQADVGRELLRRIKPAFEAADIEIPSPHQPINLGRR